MIARTGRYSFQAAACLLLCQAAGVTAQADGAGEPALLEAETSDTGTLPATGPHRLFLSAGGYGGGGAIIDGDSARIEGTVNISGSGAFLPSQDGGRFYVAESVWTKGNRGTRQDQLVVYDGTTLGLLHEIALPGRLLASARPGFFSLNASESLAYIYNFEPASSVIVVDLKGRKVRSQVEVPGCGLIYPFGDAGFATLCADGSLASVTLDATGRGQTTRSEPFFDPSSDPVFEESVVDPQSGKAWFISYSGIVFPVQLGATSTFGKPFSLASLAGLSPATSDPKIATWRPGGRRIMAYHRKSGLLYVLMHEGKPWTQKQPGTEVWVVDPEAHRLVARYAVPTDGRLVAVSQDEKPLLYVVSETGTLWVLDHGDGRFLRSRSGFGRLSTIAVQGF